MAPRPFFPIKIYRILILLLTFKLDLRGGGNVAIFEEISLRLGSPFFREDGW